MNKIRPVGGYVDLDVDGYVVNPASPDRIIPAVRQALERWLAVVIRPHGDLVHGVYLRGSVAAGQAVEGLADLDLVILLREDSLALQESLEHESRLFLAGVRPPLAPDLLICPAATAGARPRLDMVLATQACCLAGQRYSPNRRGYLPGPQMFLAIPWLVEDLADCRQPPPGTDLAQQRRALCKLLIRAAFELVMEREERYTNSLYYCVRSFARYYPRHEVLLWRALEQYINPQWLISAELFDNLMSFGDWLCEEIAGQGYALE